MRSSLLILACAMVLVGGGCNSAPGRGSKPLGWRVRDGQGRVGEFRASSNANSISYKRAAKVSVQQPRPTAPAAVHRGSRLNVANSAGEASARKSVAAPPVPSVRSKAGVPAAKRDLKPAAEKSLPDIGRGHADSCTETNGKYRVMRDMGFITEERYRQLTKDRQ